MKKSHHLTNRRCRGQHLIEVLCGLIFLIPVFLFLVNCAFIYFAATLSDGIARDCARAAAGVEPTYTTIGRQLLSNSAPNFNRAQAVVTVARTRNRGYIRDCQIVGPESACTITAVPDPFRGGQWLGTVTVRTRLSYILPVSIANPPDVLTNEAEARFPLTVSRSGTVRNFVR